MVVNQNYHQYIKEFIYIWSISIIYIHLSWQIETRKNESFHIYKERRQVGEMEKKYSY